MAIKNDKYTIEVVHCKKEPDCIYIGRPTALQNRNYLSDPTDPVERDRVCDAYEKDFADLLEQEDEAAMEQLAFIIETAIEDGHVRLGCFCAPRRCHGDTIKRFLNSVLNP